MTLSEFRAWFDGFTENIGDKLPSKKQWARIQERVGEINDVPTTYPVFIDRYYQPWAPHFSHTTVIPATNTTLTATSPNEITGSPNEWESGNAFFAAGQAEATAITFDG